MVRPRKQDPSPDSLPADSTPTVRLPGEAVASADSAEAAPTDLAPPPEVAENGGVPTEGPQPVPGETDVLTDGTGALLTLPGPSHPGGGQFADFQPSSPFSLIPNFLSPPKSELKWAILGNVVKNDGSLRIPVSKSKKKKPRIIFFLNFLRWSKCHFGHLRALVDLGASARELETRPSESISGV